MGGEQDPRANNTNTQGGEEGDCLMFRAAGSSEQLCSQPL